MTHSNPGPGPAQRPARPLSTLDHGPSLVATLLIAVAATAGFILVAVATGSETGMASHDVQIADWLHAHRSGGFLGFMRGVSMLNSVAGAGLMTLALALWLRRSRARLWLEALVLAVPGVMMLNAALKQLFARPRPYFADPWTSLASYSFPSGHVSQATVFYGFLAAWLTLHACRRGSRALILLAAVLMITLVAISRLYLGAHYLTDVVAALFEGIAWLALCRLALAWRQRWLGRSGVDR